MKIVLPFPPSSLSGHTNGAWYNKNRVVATFRAESLHLTRNAKRAFDYKVPPQGDILISFLFIPPNNLSDRTNFAGRLKPQIDGIAEALGVNDKRFLPSYHFAEPEKPGRVEVIISPAKPYAEAEGGAMEGDGPPECANTPDGPVQTAIKRSELNDPF